MKKYKVSLSSNDIRIINDALIFAHKYELARAFKNVLDKHEGTVNAEFCVIVISFKSNYIFELEISVLALFAMIQSALMVAPGFGNKDLWNYIEYQVRGQEHE